MCYPYAVIMEKDFLIEKVKNTVLWPYVIGDIVSEETVEIFCESKRV